MCSPPRGWRRAAGIAHSVEFRSSVTRRFILVNNGYAIRRARGIKDLGTTERYEPQPACFCGPSTYYGAREGNREGEEVRAKDLGMRETSVQQLQAHLELLAP